MPVWPTEEPELLQVLRSLDLFWVLLHILYSNGLWQTI
jgi:hypothetical protein